MDGVILKKGLNNFFERIFQIRAHELLLVHLFLIYITLVSTFWTVGTTVGETLFLSQLAPDVLHRFLPWIYVSIASALIAVTWIYQHYIQQLSRIKLIIGLPTFFIFTLLLLRFMLIFFGGQTWLYFLLFVWVEVCGTLLFMTFYSYMGDYFNVHDARRVYGYMVSGVALGSPMGGVGVILLLPYIEVTNLIYVAVFLLLLSISCVAVIHQYSMPQKTTTVNVEKHSPILFKKILSSPYLRLIFIFIFLGAICSYLVDYQMLILASKVYDEVNLAKFLAKFFSYVGIVQLGLDFILAGWLFKRFGVIKNLLLLPCLLFLGSLGFIIQPIFLLAVMMKFSEETMYDSLNTLAREMLFLPLPSRVRVMAQTMSHGFFSASGKLMGGVLLILFSLLNLSLPYYALVILLITLIWITCIFLLVPHYQRTVTSSLYRVGVHAFDFQQLLNNREGRFIVEKVLANADAQKMVMILKLLTFTTAQSIKPALLKLLNFKDPTVVAATLGVFAKFPDKNTLMVIQPYLSDSHVEVRTAAIFALAKLKKHQALPELESFFTNPLFQIRKASLLAAYRLCGRAGKKAVRNYLYHIHLKL